MLTGFVFDLKDILSILFAALVAGAIVAVVKGIRHGSLFKRIKRIFLYFNQAFSSINSLHEIPQETYLDTLNENEKKKYGIHFSAEILTGVIAVTIINYVR